jgi:hypothetical protein
MDVPQQQIGKLCWLPAEEQRDFILSMLPEDALRLDAMFETWAANGQLEPSHNGWRTWLMMAGRGFGKTRAGAEWIHGVAMSGKRRIALVAATIDEARAVMVEGKSGVLAVARRRNVKLTWEPSLNRIKWPSGAVATLYSGDNADGLRGPEHDFAWLLTFEVVADDAISIGGVLGDASGGLIEASDDRPLPGYAAHGGSQGDSISELIHLCGVQLAERDGKLRSPAMAPPTVIEQQELGCDAEGEARPAIERQRASRSAMPASLAMIYYDPDRDYQAGQMRAAVGGSGARDERIELPAVLNSGQARSMVEEALARSYREADLVRMWLSPSHMTLRPGDSIQLAGSGAAWTVRSMTIAGMAVEVEAGAGAVAISSLPADPGRPVTEPDVPIGRTELALFEAPPQGDVPSDFPIAYVAASAAGAWRSVPLEMRLGVEPPSSLAISRRAMLGHAQWVLEPRSPMILDELSSVIVKLEDASRPLLSADDDALMAGANLCLLGEELLQFGRAEELEAGTFRLSRLLRGRRGTEWGASTHLAGESFVMIDAALKPVKLSATAIGVELTVIAHGIGDVAPLPEARKLVTGETMRPPSPCRLRLWSDGTAVGAIWVRRSHRDWAWLDEIGVPDDAFAERYRVRVDGPADSMMFETETPSIAWGADELLAGPGETILVSVATIGPKAVSHEISATLTL